MNMKKSNAQIFREIESEIQNYEKGIIDSLMTEEEKKATHVYTYKFDREEEKYVIEEWDIDEIAIYYEPYVGNCPKINKRASERDIKSIQKYFSDIKEADKEIRFFIIKRHKLGKSLYSTNLDDLRNGNEYTFTKEALMPLIEHKNKEWVEYYKPREGYTPCAYCHKQVPNDKIIKREILTIGYDQRLHKQVLVTLTKDFCSGQCAFNEQCANEG